MLRLIALTTLLAAPAHAQFADTPWLKDSLSAIHFQTQSLQTEMAATATPDVSKYSIRGIDVSRYEKNIDWTKIQEDGLSFVFIEATHGLAFVDDGFAANWKGSSTTKLARSAYHFYDFCKSGIAQADFFIKTVPNDGNLLPMVLDLEQNALCKKMPDRDAFRKQLAAFVTKVTARYGLKPILYINYSIYEQYLKGANDGYKLWIADPRSKTPNMPDGQSWAFWQYNWHGKVGGIDGEVDLDVFSGTPEMLAGLKQPSGVMYAGLQ
jgi:lysozyme